MKHAGKKLLTAAVLMLFAILFAVQVSAASAVNTQAHKAYSARMKSIATSVNLTNMNYKYVDLDGDGVHECILYYHRTDNGSGSEMYIYSYDKNTKSLIQRLEDRNYGMYKIWIYQKSGSFVMHSAGHGGEHYDYYKMENGTYVLKAMRGRTSTVGGGTYNGPWSYTVNGTSASASAFRTMRRSIEKGTAKVIGIQKFLAYPV